MSTRVTANKHEVRTTNNPIGECQPRQQATARARRRGATFWRSPALWCLGAALLLGIGVAPNVTKNSSPLAPGRPDEANHHVAAIAAGSAHKSLTPTEEVVPISNVSEAAQLDSPESATPSAPATSNESLFREFDAWINDYATSPEPAALEHSGKILAQRRRLALAELIRTDPEASLRASVPISLRQKLPAAVSDELEERVSGRGDLMVIASLPDSQSALQPEAIRRYVSVNGHTYRAYVYGRRLTQGTTSNLPLHGIAVGDLLAVHEDPVRPLEVGEQLDPALPVANPDGRCPISAAPVNPLVTVDVGGEIYHLCCGEHAQAFNQTLCSREDLGLPAVSTGRFKAAGTGTWTTGVKTVLFIRVSFADEPAASISAERAEQLMSDVNEFFQANSFGAASLQTTITPAVALPGSTAFYNGRDLSLLGDARTAAAAAGYDPSNYDFDCVFCGPHFAVNQAFIGAKGAWVSQAIVGTVAHELGHNFGLYHANSWVTTDGSSIGTGSNVEYGNYFDTMGYGQFGGYAFNAYEKAILAWLPPEAVQAVSTGGVYRLSPLDMPTLTEGSTCALRIPKDAERDYWIETRQTPGDPQLQDSVLLLWSPWSASNGGSQLLNCNPSVKGQRTLHIGQVFYDLDIGLKVVPLQKLGSDIEVAVSQVYYLPVEFNLAGTAAGASASAAPHLRIARAGWPATGTTASAQVTIPQSGSYYFWVQTPGAEFASASINLRVDDETMPAATTVNFGAPSNSGWSVVRWAPALKLAGAEPRSFFLAQGEHTITVQADGGAPAVVRLLITNDAGPKLPPVLSSIGDQALLVGQSLTVPFYIAAVGDIDSNLTVRVFCDNPMLLPQISVSAPDQGNTGAITLTASNPKVGNTHVTLSVTDELGRIYNQSFQVKVLGPIQSLIDNAPAGSTVAIPTGTNYDTAVIAKDLNLIGAGMDQSVIYGEPTGIPMIVSSNCNVTISGVTIRNSRAAGVRNYGNLHIVSCLLSQNLGGAIDNRGALVLENSILQNNHGSIGGLNNFGSASIRNCAIDSNVGDGGPGGIMNRRGASLRFESGCISRNTALGSSGGGIFNAGTLTLQTATICSNVATQVQKAESERDHMTGGGIENTGQLTVESSTICRNQADWEGGGLDNHGTALLGNCILAGNRSLNTLAMDASGALDSEGHNLIESPSGCTGTVSADIIGVDPLLGSLDNHGGPTETVALSPGSPAIDAGNCSIEETADQRGFGRPAGGACDIGAFEARPGFVIVQEPSGAIRFQTDVQSNHSYAVQASSDLVQWVTLTNPATSADGILEFVDMDAPLFQNRVYRILPADNGP